MIPYRFFKSFSSPFSLFACAAETLKFSWISCTSPPRFLISTFFFSMTPFRRSTSCVRILILFSPSVNTLLSWFSVYPSLRLSSSFSVVKARYSAVIFWSWPADNLRFSWAFLTSSSNVLFSVVSFCTLTLNISDSWDDSPSLFLN